MSAKNFNRKISKEKTKNPTGKDGNYRNMSGVRSLVSKEYQ